MEYRAQQYLVIALLGCTGTNPSMAIFVLVSTVLRSCLVEIHWQITHIWHSSCFVEIRWRAVIAYLIYTGIQLRQSWGSISTTVLRDGGA